MDSTLCNVIYVDQTILQDRVFRSPSTTELPGLPDRPDPQLEQHDHTPEAWESQTLQSNASLIAGVFGHVYLCGTGAACIAKLFNLQDESMLVLKPTIVLIHTPDDSLSSDESSQARSRSPSPHSAAQPTTQKAPASPAADDIYGLRLLQRIVSEAHLRNLTKLVVPVPVISLPPGDALASTTAKSRALWKRCLKMGATDVIFSPIQIQSIPSLEVHAYRARKSAARDQQDVMEVKRGRKRSWVGITESRPYAYLRETMVATLMRRICQMDDANEMPVDAIRIFVTPSRKQLLATAVGSWHFSAHDFTDDELVELSAIMFRHALTMPELADWRIPTDQLICFLIACRAAYNSFVPYHNFRHVVDVLQATFHFLVSIGALPPYPLSSSPGESASAASAKPPMVSLLKPCEALTLLITAIGHDVGHPGVNNGFLVVLNTPLAQLYNDRSVLESFHCAAYSQILRRYWPAAFSNTKMRNLMISSILATDMGLHFDYMKKLGSIQDKLGESNTTDGWNGRMFDEQTSLACALLIKCADISNVARRHDAAVQWMHILSDEFSRQAFMENQLAIKSSLMSVPKKDNVSLFRAQLGFMNMFAIPLFQGVASIMPAMQYCVDELEVNKGLFERAIAEELVAQEDAPHRALDGTFSPRTMSVAVPAPTAHEAMPCPAALAAAIPTISETMGGSSRLNSRGGDGAGTANGAASVDGIMSDSSAVSDFAASDRFNSTDCQVFVQNKQRVSETTDGGTSIPTSGGDWASQATSATTGKTPISPSTQGTSITSRDSLDRPLSLPVVSIHTAEDMSDSLKSHPDALMTTTFSGEDQSSLSSNGNGAGNGTLKMLPEDRTLKKKGSRFRMNALTFFRRHLSQSPPIPSSHPHHDSPAM